MKFLGYEIRWVNSIFLISTFLVTMIGMPLYIWHYGLDAFQIALFLVFFISTGLSITLGYHRLFSHLTFHAAWPVKLYVLLFGAAAFEGSALSWSADHRRHHKFVDHEEDPYDITRGFFHAHIGWLLFRTGPDTPLTWVRDLQKDKLAWWQHEYYVPLAIAMGFGLPTLLGWLWGGPVAALGGFLIAGTARIVFVHHMTFCINSLCHWIGDRPYSSKCTARDSFLMALFTFGEGYHNFHHEFQHDYRNGIKAWHWDPTKWTIWILARLGLAKDLRTVPMEKILRAQIAEHERQIATKIAAHPNPEHSLGILEAARAKVHEAAGRWEELLTKYRALQAHGERLRHSAARSLKRDLRNAQDELQSAIREWVAAQRLLLDESPTA